MSEQTALAGRIKEYLIDLERVVNRVVMLCEKATKSGDDGYWDAVALNLHGFYGGVERIFEDIARTVDQSLPSGPEWHQGLLIQMSSETSERRPAVITRELRRVLDEYRGFRHVVRNVYAFNFRPDRLNELANDLWNCFNALKKELTIFIEFLEALEK
jgi:hypothetical protein